jgi:hypothetical protein
VGQGGGNTAFGNGNFYLGEAPEYQVCVCDGPIKMAHCPQKKKKNLGKQPPSHELKHEYTTIVQYMPILCFPCISNLT